MRKKPYTEIGISRVRCFRCGGIAKYQWQICSMDNLFCPICVHCDIALNALVLEFMRVPNWKDAAGKYQAEKLKLKQ